MIIRQSQTVSDSNILLGSMAQQFHNSINAPGCTVSSSFHPNLLTVNMNECLIHFIAQEHTCGLIFHKAWNIPSLPCWLQPQGLARPQTALLWPVVQEKYTHPMPHKPWSTRSRALSLRSWGKIYCCRFSLVLDVRLGSPLNAGKIEGKRRDQNGLKCTYCVNMGNEVQMLLQKGEQSVSGALRSYSFSSALPMIFLDTFVIDTIEGL